MIKTMIKKIIIVAFILLLTWIFFGNIYISMIATIFLIKDYYKDIRDQEEYSRKLREGLIE